MTDTHGWLEARLDTARAIPTDVLLVAIAGLGLLTVLVILAWRRAARRASSAKLKLTQLETEFADVRAKLEGEVRWRTAAEKWERNQKVPSPIKPVIEGR